MIQALIQINPSDNADKQKMNMLCWQGRIIQFQFYGIGALGYYILLINAENLEGDFTFIAR